MAIIRVNWRCQHVPLFATSVIGFAHCSLYVMPRTSKLVPFRDLKQSAGWLLGDDGQTDGRTDGKLAVG